MPDKLASGCKRLKRKSRKETFYNIVYYCIKDRVINQSSVFLTIIIFLIACTKIEYGQSLYSINDSFIVSQIENEIIAHASNIIVSKSGKCYVVYYAGDNAEVEAIKGTDICVKILSFKNPSFVDNRKVVLKPGDVVKNFWQSYDYSPYDPCLIEIDEFIRIWMVLTPINGDVRDCCIGFRDYNPKTQELDSSIGLCNISYYKNNQLITLPLSIENLNKFADDIRNTETGYHFVGDYPVFNTVKSIDGVLYTIMSFISSNNQHSISPVILKSNDNGANWVYVDTINSLYDEYNIWEVGWDCDEDGNMYIIARMDLNLLSPCFVFNTKKTAMMLQNVVFDGITEGGRPYILYSNNYLYILQNINNPFLTGLRKCVRIAKSDIYFSVKKAVDIYKETGISYFSLYEQNSSFYLLYTGDSRGIAPGHKGDIEVFNISKVIKQL